MCNLKVVLLSALLGLLTLKCDCLPSKIRIGGLFDSDEEEQELAFRFAIDRINADPSFLGESMLIAHVERVGKQDSFYAQRKVCSFLRNGVAAIFGPLDSVSSMQVQSICDVFEVPHVEMRWDFELKRTDLSINLYPRPEILARAYVDIVKAWNWKSFAIVYEDNEGIIKMQDFFKSSSRNNKWKIKMYQFKQDQPYRDTFWLVKNSQEVNIILDVKKENLLTVLKHAQQVGLFTEVHSYLLTTLDLHVYDLEDFRYSKAKVTYLRLVDENNIELRTLLMNWNHKVMELGKGYYKDPWDLIKTDSALIYDAVKLTATALRELDQSQRIDIHQLSCENEIPWIYGSSLINYMRPVRFQGLTGTVAFDESGYRSDVSFDVLSATQNDFVKVAVWAEFAGQNHLNKTKAWTDQYLTKGLQNKTIIVTTLLQPPYTMRKDSHESKSGNEEFEGFAIDLIDELSRILHFQYLIKLVKDKKHGSFSNGKWNGMVGEVMRGEADIAIADLTINSKRETAIDFTYPFLNTGISILYKKPKDKDFSLFSFLDPFSITVWIYMLGAFVGVTVVFWVVGRFTPYEWCNPHPCRQDDQVLENNLGMLNCFWFAIGSLMQQGCDVAPRAMSTRTISGIWYFFTLIIISSYTANLAAFLTIEKTVYPINNVEELANQDKIKYGCLGGGSTASFFIESTFPTYKKMGEFMAKNPDVFLSNNEEGQRRVERENGAYAFLMESTSIEYVIERRCNLTQIGGLLDNKFYGIATRKNSPIRNVLSQGILHLQETGMLHVLKDRWWKQKKGGGTCSAEASKSSSSVPELTLNNVGGVFVVLIGGSFSALLICICEFAWKARRNAGNDMSWLDYMKQDLKYISDCQSSTKPVIKKSDLASQKSKSTTPQQNVESLNWNHLTL